MTRAELAYAVSLRRERWLVVGDVAVSRCPLCWCSLGVGGEPAVVLVHCFGGCASALVLLAWLGQLGRRGKGLGVDVARCGSCGAPIRWGMTLQGARMPVDAAATPGGTVYPLQEGPNAGKLRILSGPEVQRALNAGIDTYTSHFATCPDAAGHRGIPRDQLALEL